VERALELVMKERERIRSAHPTRAGPSAGVGRARARQPQAPNSAGGAAEPARLPIVTLGPLIHTPQVVERLRGLNVTPDGNTPAAFRQFVEEELKRFAEMVKLSGYKPE
jgi:hypothetical protein